MTTCPPSPAAVGLCVLVVLVGSLRGAEPRATTARVVPLAVHEGHCECVLDTPTGTEQFYVVLGSLAQSQASVPIQIETAATTEPARFESAESAVKPGWQQQLHDWHDLSARARLLQLPDERYHPAAAPPAERSFYLFMQEHDFQNAAGYELVRGRLHAVGRLCQVYVDGDDPHPEALKPTIDDIVRTFDDQVQPRARRELGRTLDVDRDGRFTILLSGRLGRLCNGKVALGGFVRGSDFYRDLPAPYGNRCDMMYLNTDLRPGPHLRTILAHEYTHAVIFTEHVFGDYLADQPRQDEESWLNEGLAHLAEDRHGFGWSNLDYRISAYLSDPARAPIVVPDAYAAGLWRHHGHRGALYLFLRWCSDRYGAELLPDLIRSNLSGVRNLEAATQTSFPQLFRDFSTALVLGGSGIDAAGVTPIRRLDLRQPLAGRLLCGPRPETLAVGAAGVVILAGTGVAPVLIHSPSGARTRVRIQAEPNADLQVTLIRLPSDLPRLTVTATRAPGTSRVRLEVRVQGGTVTLDGAAWERRTPTDNRPEDTSYQTGSKPIEQARAWFGAVALAPGAVRTSAEMDLPAVVDGWVVKVSATDAVGRHIAAWALVDGQ